jgi:hypothetical protein
MKKHIVILSVAAGLMVWGCSKIDSELNLKQSVEKGVADINNAVSIISGTKGYEMLTASGEAAKGDDSFNDSITLKMVAGVYDFQPRPPIFSHLFYPYRLFKKTGTSDKMIVNLPEKLIFHPKYLHFIYLADTALKNNFSVRASDYHFYYNWWRSLDYKLVSDFTLDSNPLGTFEMESKARSFNDQSYLSKFTFKEGYNITKEWETGDTTISSFALMKDDDILLKEYRMYIWNRHSRGEKQYTMTIGNIDLKRTKGIDSMQVFLDGVLQKKAAAYIKDSSDSTGTFCHKRDIVLTFDDGSTKKLSEMINPAVTALKTLYDSMESMYFAKNIVDYISVSIYYNTH